jgi:hypothetical protein
VDTIRIVVAVTVEFSVGDSQIVPSKYWTVQSPDFEITVRETSSGESSLKKLSVWDVVVLLVLTSTQLSSARIPGGTFRATSAITSALIRSHFMACSFSSGWVTSLEVSSSPDHGLVEIPEPDLGLADGAKLDQ